MPEALRERNRKRLRQIRLDKRRKMFSGRLVNGIVDMTGAPTNRTWVRYPENSAEETLAWGNVTRANVPVWVDKNKAGQNEIVGVEYVEGTIRWGGALETVGAPPIIDELLPTSVGELGFLPGRVSASPSGGTYVRVTAFEHTGGRYPTTDIDVGTEYPATDDAYGRIGLYLNPDTNTVTAFAGEEVFDRSDFTDADKLSVPDGMYPLGAVIVYDGNAISSANTFEDWRLHHSALPAAGSTAHEILIDDVAQTQRADLNILSSDWLKPIAADDPVNDETELAYTLDPAGVSNIGTPNITDDLIPIWDDSAGAMKYVTPAALGASGGGSFTPSWANVYNLTPPDINDFTWVNQGSATATQQGDQIFISVTNGSGEALRILKKAAPATPYTVTAAFIGIVYPNSSVAEMGICWRENSSSKLVVARRDSSATNFILSVTKHDNTTAGVAHYVTNNTSPLATVFWWKLEDDGTNRKVYFSNDGVNFLQYHNVGRTDYLTADEIGFFVGGTSSAFVGMTLLSWEEA